MLPLSAPKPLRELDVFSSADEMVDVDDEDVMWCIRCDEDVFAMRLVVVLLFVVDDDEDSFELEFIIYATRQSNNGNRKEEKKGKKRTWRIKPP